MSPAKVVCAASVAALVIAPALVWRHVYPLPGFLEEALAVGLGLVLAACVLLLVPRGATRIPTLTFPIVALAGLISIQLALGRYEHASVPHLALAESLWLIAVIWAGRSLSDAWGFDGLLGVVAGALLAGGLASAAIAIVQAANLRDSVLSAVTVWPAHPEATRRAFANLAQPNLLAHYLCLAVAALAYCFSSGRLRAGLALAAGLPLVYALHLTGSRLALASLIAFPLVALLTLAARRTRVDVRMASFTTAALLAYLLAGPVASVLGWPTGEGAFGRALAADGGSIAMRVHIWRHALAMFGDAPLLGNGVGSFAWRYFEQSVDFPQRFEGIERNAHNGYLHVAAELGMFGVLIASWLTVEALRAGWARREERLAAFWWMAMSVVFIHSMVEFPLWHTPFLAIFGLLLGAAAPRCIEVRASRVAAAAMALALLGGGTKLWRDWSAWNAVSAVLSPTSFHAFRDGKERDAGEAHDVARGTTLEPYLTQRIALYAQPDESGVQPLAAYVLESLRFWPNDRLAIRAALLQLDAGNEEEGERLLARIAAVYPSAFEQLRRANFQRRRIPPDLLARAAATSRSPAFR